MYTVYLLELIYLLISNIYFNLGKYNFVIILNNQVSISRVYPCVVALRVRLLENIDSKRYKKKLRNDLVESLDRRFKDLIDGDLFILSTFLDPFFGPITFSSDKLSYVKMRLKYHLGLLNPENQINNVLTAVENKQRSVSNFIFHDVESTIVQNIDDFDILIKQYVDQVNNKTFEDPLVFWKCHAIQFPELSILAKKFLGVPASSAAVERMFNISGHILTNRRRKTGVELFQNLVYLKLNEELL